MTFDHNPSMRVPSRLGRGLSVGILAVLQLVFVLWASRTAIVEMTHCEFCDTTYYLTSANEFSRSGLLFANHWDGYRSYFVPAVVAAVEKISATAGYDGSDVKRYVHTITLLFLAYSVGAMWWLSKRVSVRQFFFAAAATIVNPFLIAYVPFALQEGVLMALCLPLLFIWIGARDLGPRSRAALAIIIALIAYVTRSALVWWIVPAVLYAAWIMRPYFRHPRQWMPTVLAVGFAGAVLLGPQIYVVKQKFNSINPYPSTALLSNQIAWGISLIKFASIEDHGHWRQLAYLSPFVAEPEDSKTIHFYWDRPARGAFLLLGHAYAGFHYDEIKPYWQIQRSRILTFWLLLSSAIVFLGVTQMAVTVVSGQLNADGAFSIATLALCAASLVLTATESRFGIVGFVMLSAYALQLLARRPTREQWALLLPGLLLYLALSFLFNALMMQNGDIGL
jgi:hypothetical protein